jgi:ABC-2 type transport system ATP-binding protein
VPSAISTTDLTKHYPGVPRSRRREHRGRARLDLRLPRRERRRKTTALKILAGLSRPTSGSATVAGVPLAAGESYKRAIGYLGQEPRFYDWMTARETLRYVAGFYPWCAIRSSAGSTRPSR